jgi:hypothetical protein
MNVEIGWLESIFFVFVFLGVSLWKAVYVQTQTTVHPYVFGFGILSQIQWIGVSFGMITIFGWIFGLVATFITMTLLSSVAGLTLGFLWLKIAKKNYFLPSGLFSINVWVIVGIGLALIIFR